MSWNITFFNFLKWANNNSKLYRPKQIVLDAALSYTGYIEIIFLTMTTHVFQTVVVHKSSSWRRLTRSTPTPRMEAWPMCSPPRWMWFERSLSTIYLWCTRRWTDTWTSSSSSHRLHRSQRCAHLHVLVLWIIRNIGAGSHNVLNE